MLRRLEPCIVGVRHICILLDCSALFLWNLMSCLSASAVLLSSIEVPISTENAAQLTYFHRIQCRLKLGPDCLCSCSGLWLVRMWTGPRVPIETTPSHGLLRHRLFSVHQRDVRNLLHGDTCSSVDSQCSRREHGVYK